MQTAINLIVGFPIVIYAILRVLIVEILLLPFIVMYVAGASHRKGEAVDPPDWAGGEWWLAGFIAWIFAAVLFACSLIWPLS